AARLAALVGDAGFAAVMALDVTQSPIGDDGARALAQSPHTGKLKSLWLDRTGITDAGAQALGAASLPLVELYVGYNPIGPDGLKALLAAPAADYFILRLSFTRVGDAGAALLAQSPRLPKLQRLELTAAGLTDAGVRALLSSPGLERLDTLELGHNAAGPRAIEPLLDADKLPALRTLDLSGVPLDAALIEQVKARRPDLDVVTGG
ncbi:MAG: hypothetical protein KC549_10585, partial [Myxococcales bacterium]|nr:hypothetical protein [Myxococcales bacterium]